MAELLECKDAFDSVHKAQEFFAINTAGSDEETIVEPQTSFRNAFFLTVKVGSIHFPMVLSHTSGSARPPTAILSQNGC